MTRLWRGYVALKPLKYYPKATLDASLKGEKSSGQSCQTRTYLAGNDD